MPKRTDTSRAYILGVKTGGIALAKNIRSSADSPYTLEGFVTDETENASAGLNAGIL